jgi:hypothetical protein
MNPLSALPIPKTDLFGGKSEVEGAMKVADFPICMACCLD